MIEALEILDRMRASRCAPNQVRGVRVYREVRNMGNFV